VITQGDNKTQYGYSQCFHPTQDDNDEPINNWKSAIGSLLGTIGIGNR
jgi:hypothetical protein